MDENQARTSEFFQNKTFTAEESRPEFLHKGHAQLNTGLRKEERVALSHDALPRSKIKSLNPSRVAARKPDFAISVGPEIRNEKGLTRNGPLQRPQQFLPQGLSRHARIPC